MPTSPYAELDSLRYLFLRELVEPEENQLRVVVEEARPNAAKRVEVPENLESSARTLFENATPVESITGCRSYELTWEHYVAYLVTEEGTGSCGDYRDERYTGTRLRTYSRSHFLAHLGRDTGAHLRPLLHYKLLCEHHLIDVASYEPPRFRHLGQRF